MTHNTQQRSSIGGLIRKWRDDRRISQLALASRADVSARHLSFVETGRSAPSRSMVLRLAEQLDVPLRDRNQMLLAAGYAPVFSESSLHTPRLSMVRTAVRRVLAGHEPFPALVVDGGWNLVEANTAVALLTEDAPDDLLAPPMNILRYSLHPRGLAARMLNLPQWRSHVLNHLERQMNASGGDPRLAELYRELITYPATNDLTDEKPVHSNEDDHDMDFSDVFVPLLVLLNGRQVSLFSTVTIFSTPQDVTVEELHIENFYPSDQATEEFLRAQ